MTEGGLIDPKALGPARAEAHAAAQLLYRAAVSNCAPRPGDEHTNLGWDGAAKRFKTHPLDASGLTVDLSLDPLTIFVGEDALSLTDTPIADAFDRVDALLTANGLKPTRPITATYDLPDDVLRVATFRPMDGLATLAHWFDRAAEALQDFADEVAHLDPGPSPVRCWPHHFDIATYVALEPGGSEEARGIGVGLSPGDASYDEPYFYVNPWPHLPPDGVPADIPPGHWHTNGFVGSIATGTEILTLADPKAGTRAFLRESFRAGRIGLGL
ncbi:MAG: hypothetical protein AAGD34_07770 [Pseudomonadota bacterium]